jgi:hypothetical protein
LHLPLMVHQKSSPKYFKAKVCMKKLVLKLILSF